MKWKYYIGVTEVFPLNAGLEEYSFERKSPSSVRLDKTISSSFIFSTKNSGFDFVAQVNSNPAEELEFEIKDGATTVFEGVFVVGEGDFDNVRGFFKIKTRQKEQIFQDDVTVDFFGGAEVIKDGSNLGVFTSAGGVRNYQNAFKFDSVLLTMAKKINPKILGIISDFFQINPINVSSDCLPGVPNLFTKMAFCALSDVQEPVPSNFANYNPIKFSDILDDLNALFDVYWWIDENFYLRLEHRSFFTTAVWLDLTDPIYAKYISAKSKFKFNLEEYNRSEVLKIIDSQQTARIRYNQLSTINKGGNEKSVSTKVIRTDYADIRYNGNNHGDYGLFLFATEHSSAKYNMIVGGAYENSGSIFSNNWALTPTYLMQYIHTYDKPYLYGLFDSLIVSSGGHYTISGFFQGKSLAKTKLFDPVSIPLCNVNDIEASGQVTTSFGSTNIHSAKYSAKTRMLKLELKAENVESNTFLPSDLSGQQLWLRQDTGISISGGLITQWNDQSGNGRHATASGGGTYQPRYNSVKKAVRLNLEWFMTIPSFQMFPGKRGCIVLAIQTPQGVWGIPDMTFITNHDRGVTAGTYYDVTFSDYNPDNHRFKNTSQGVTLPTNNTFLMNNVTGLYIINRVADTVEEYRHNCLTPFENTSYNPQTIPNTQPSAHDLYIGYNPGLPYTLIPNSLDSLMYELIMYDRALTQVEIEKIEFYFAKKAIFNAYS